MIPTFHNISQVSVSVIPLNIQEEIIKGEYT